MKLVILSTFVLIGLVVLTLGSPIETEETSAGLVVKGARRDGTIYSYFISGFAASWETARKYCADSGRQLLMIKNDLKQAEIKNLLIANHAYDGRWLNLLVPRDSATWIWGDVTPVTYHNFVSSGGAVVGQRAAISPNLDYTWSALEGVSQKKFICESF